MSANATAGVFPYPPAWKNAAGTISAVLMAVVFFVAGAWKLTEPFLFSQLLGELRVPADLTLPLGLAVGIADTIAALLIIVPGWRRWGAILMSVLLVAYMGYLGINYHALAGKECNCFPIVKRTVGPGLFIGDTVMLVLAILAGIWARRSSGIRGALAAFAAVLVFAAAAYGVNAAKNSGVAAPSPIAVDGKPYSLDQGHVFLFFYNPSCLHCDAAARRMSKYDWKDTTVIALPTESPEWAASFLHDTGLKALTSLDTAKERTVFHFMNAPYGVALENGREKAVIADFDDSQPARTLRSIGYVR